MRGMRFIRAYSSALQLLHSVLKSVAQDDEAVASLVQRTGQLFSELRYLMESTSDSAVFWIERRLAAHGTALNTFIQATPIDVSEILAASVFETYDTTVLTSATLAVQKGFSHVRKALGIVEAEEIIVPLSLTIRSKRCCMCQKTSLIRAMTVSSTPQRRTSWKSFEFARGVLSACSPATR